MPPGKNKDEHVRLEEGSEEDGINLNWRFVLASLLHLLVIFGFGISVAAFVCWVQSDFQQTPDYSVFGLLLPFLGIAIYYLDEQVKADVDVQTFKADCGFYIGWLRIIEVLCGLLVIAYLVVNFNCVI